MSSELRVDSNGLAVTTPQQAATQSQAELNRIADNLQADHFGWQREIASAEAAASAATAAWEQASVMRNQALERLYIARQNGEVARRESYLATNRALGRQLESPPVTTADYPAPLSSILPQPGGAYEKERPAQVGPNYIASILAATPSALGPDTKYEHIKAHWRGAWGPLPTKAELGLESAQSPEPAKAGSKKEGK